MIQFQRIHSQDALYPFMESLMQQAFPSEEYRDPAQQRQYTDEKAHFHCNIVTIDGQEVGLINFWDFDTFYYFEHLAILPQQRNGGIGKKVMNSLCQQLNRPIVLEVEMPDNELAQRRIGFYQRQGFKLWDNPYLQPPYKAGDDFLPMHLMVYGDLSPEHDFENIKARIYKEVYGVTEENR